MKLLSIINIIVFNGVALILAALVYDDRVYRVSYWRSLGFTTTTRYYPFFYVTAATRGTTYIPGLLTLDWLQVILVITLIADLGFAWSIAKGRRGSAGMQAETASNP